MTDETNTTTDALEEDPRPDGLRSTPSLVLVNTGNGKGKSSSAFGMMLRALAVEWPVAVVQFIKSGDWKVGEEQMGRQLGVDWHSFGDGFTWDSDDLTNDKAHAHEGWSAAKAIIEAGEHRLVILDELTYLCSWGWIDQAEVISTIVDRPDHVNVVVTGRDAPAELIEIADTVTEMTEVKHAYQQGIRAKRGIDGVATLYGDDAEIVRYDGVAATIDEIRAYHESYLARNGSVHLQSVDQLRDADDVLMFDALVDTDLGVLQAVHVIVFDSDGKVRRHIPGMRGFWGQ